MRIYIFLLILNYNSIIFIDSLFWSKGDNVDSSHTSKGAVLLKLTRGGSRVRSDQRTNSIGRVRVFKYPLQPIAELTNYEFWLMYATIFFLVLKEVRQPIKG